MCGIVTIFAYGGGRVDLEELRLIRDHMASRGPDGYGEWYSEDNHVGLGHRRLAIIDLSETGSQPMRTEDGGLVITFNGEIYNYRALRVDLERKGYRFHSQSDTEVLLYLYKEKGKEMVHDLRGMFAFGIWDNERRGLFLARDPFGIKPLYYSDDGKNFRAASQTKALLKSDYIDTAPEPAGHVGFFLWGHIPEPYTLYKGIRSLPAGSWMWIDQNGHKTFHTYCSLTDIFAEAERESATHDPREIQEVLRNSLLDSVRHHLVADVPVGIFLSSGMDSTTLLALASEIAGGELHTVTLGFEEYVGSTEDETPLASLVSERYGTRHQTIWVSVEDFKKDLTHIMASMDQPTTDGVNSYFICKAAALAKIKVAISGLGGDEIFGSYPSFRQIPRLVATTFPLRPFPAIGKVFRWISAPLIKHLTSPKYAGLFEYGRSYSSAYLLRRGMFMPWELPDLLGDEIVREGWRKLDTFSELNKTVDGIRNSYLKVSSLELSWYMRNQLLRDTDWASMAHSLEVRPPFVDIQLFKDIAPFLPHASRPCKKDAARTPVKPLPADILAREKTGFSIPVKEWLLKEIRGNSPDRGLRGWAKFIYTWFTNAR